MFCMPPVPRAAENNLSQKRVLKSGMNWPARICCWPIREIGRTPNFTKSENYSSYKAGDSRVRWSSGVPFSPNRFESFLLPTFFVPVHSFQSEDLSPRKYGTIFLSCGFLLELPFWGVEVKTFESKHQQSASSRNSRPWMKENYDSA